MKDQTLEFITNVSRQDVCNHRWFVVKNTENGRPMGMEFGNAGMYNLYNYANGLTTHNLYMVYLVEYDEDIQSWFESPSIDYQNIHISMLAFVPRDYNSTPYAVHFYIDKDIWGKGEPLYHPLSRLPRSRSSLPNLALKLHGFSATAITKIIGLSNNTENSFRILSSPNDLMMGILTRDIQKNREDYKLPSDDDDFFYKEETVSATYGTVLDLSEYILSDYIQDNEGNPIGPSKVYLNFAIGTNISIKGMRLKKRFEAEITDRDIETKIKNVYFWLEKKKPPENCLDELYTKLCGDNDNKSLDGNELNRDKKYEQCKEVLNNIQNWYSKCFGKKSLKNEYEQFYELIQRNYDKTIYTFDVSYYNKLKEDIPQCATKIQQIENALCNSTHKQPISVVV